MKDLKRGKYKKKPKTIPLSAAHDIAKEQSTITLILIFFKRTVTFVNHFFYLFEFLFYNLFPRIVKLGIIFTQIILLFCFVVEK